MVRLPIRGRGSYDKFRIVIEMYQDNKGSANRLTRRLSKKDLFVIKFRLKNEVFTDKGLSHARN